MSLKGEQLLRQIAAETGGRAFFPWNAKELAEAHAAIAADVQHRYRLAYTPTNQRKDGTWRAITLSATNPSYKVRARSGYEALHPPPVRASVEFTATDQARQYVDLAREDLEVIEDGVAQQVDVFHEAVAPVAIVLAVDASGSMSRAAEVARQAAAHFVDAVRPERPARGRAVRRQGGARGRPSGRTRRGARRARQLHASRAAPRCTMRCSCRCSGSRPRKAAASSSS